MMKIISITLVFISTQVNLFSQEYWISQYSPTTNNLSVCFFADTLNGWIGGDSGLILHTTNNGENWTLQNSGVQNEIVSMYFVSKYTGYALSLEFDDTPPSHYGTRILTTTDAGNNWSNYLFQDTNLFLNTIYFLDSLKGFMGGSNGKLFYTNNSGVNWNEGVIDSGIIFGFPVEEIKFYNANTGYAVGGSFDIAGAVWKTSTGGITWRMEIVGSEPVHDLYILDSFNVIGMGGDFEYGVSKVETSTGGEKWNYTELGIFGIANTIAFRNETEAWASLGIVDSFLISTNSGSNWSIVSSPDNSRIYDIFFTTDKKGWAVGIDGVILKYNSNVINIFSENNYLPGSINLYQNYPNPFNPNTNISYNIKSSGRGFNFVTLIVYDVLGKEIAKLVNEKQTSGLYNVTFDGSNFQSGIYFYRIFVKDQFTNKEYFESKKMIILK